MIFQITPPFFVWPGNGKERRFQFLSARVIPSGRKSRILGRRRVFTRQIQQLIGPTMTEIGKKQQTGTLSRSGNRFHISMVKPYWWQASFLLYLSMLTGLSPVVAQIAPKSELTFPISQLESRATMKLLSKKDGLSQTNVFDLLQDKNGFIWTTSGEGLNKYDGYSFAFEILPPWWRTIWAYLAYAALLGGFFYQVDRFQRRRLSRKQEEQARIDRAELEAEKASAQARVLQAENDVKELELKKAKELKYAFSALQKALDDLKTTQDQLIHSEKMASLGALTAGIAHEIKNPLNFINNFAEINSELADDLLEALPPSAQTEELRSILDSMKENSAVIGKHGKRADSIVRNMLQHASGKAGELESTDFNRLVGEYVDLAFHGKRSQMDSFQSEIKRDFSPDVDLVPVVPQEFSRVVLNLLGNAFDAVQERALLESGPFAPLVEIRTSRVGDHVEMRVIDNGTGIKAENMDEVFKPFFTTKPTGAGTGLGLSMSYDIVVKAHNGTMRAESNEHGGATFVVTVPG